MLLPDLPGPSPAAPADRAALAASLAASPSPEARRRLGALLLDGADGAPPDPAEGVRLLRRAHAEDDPEAPRILAVLAALGAGGAPNWTEAARLLRTAAERGSPQAQGALALLAAGPGEPAPPTSVDGEPARRGATEAVDVDAWRRAPPRLAVSETPRIRRIPNFLGPGGCAWLRKLGARSLAPARVYGDRGGEGRTTEARSNSAAELRVSEIDPFVVMVRERVAAAAGVPPVVLEPPQILRYRPGERFAPHVDYLDAESAGQRPDLFRRGQRIITVLVYLNDGFEEGETRFPLADLKVRGAAGEAVLWANVDPSGRADPRSRHEGAPPLSGEKWVYSQWIRDRSPPPV